MARLIGDKPMTASENVLYRFAMEKLPDYIYVAFSQPFQISGTVRECDALFFIPHMGVFAVEINGADQLDVVDGKIMLTYKNGMSRPWRYEKLSMMRHGIRHYLKEKFNVTPFICDMQCFPYISADPEKKRELTGIAMPEKFIFQEDLNDADSFLLKLQLFKILYDKMGFNKDYFCDLTDRMAHNIFYYWETGMDDPDRPAKPPFLFLSYNKLNFTVAQEIKEELEKRGIFVWRAPEDVSIGEHYLPEEMEAIEKSDAFLILLSSSAQISKEVKVEFEKAVELNKKILPIWVEDCIHAEYYEKALTKYQYRLMTKPNIGILNEIAQAVKKFSLEQHGRKED